MAKVHVTEAQVKKQVTEYLTLQQNMGKLLFLRLNSGSKLIDYGDHKHLIQMCPKGTADFVVFQGHQITESIKSIAEALGDTLILHSLVTFLEIKSSTGKQTADQVLFAQKAMKQNCRYFIVNDKTNIEEIV